jgi:hypothetical protein
MTRPPDRSAITWAGLAGGVAMLVVLALIAPLAGIAPMGLLRMIAAVFMGRVVLPPPSLADGGIAGLGLLVHFALSTSFALLLEVVLVRYQPRGAILAGVGFGLVLYLVDFHLLGRAFPWFAPLRGWIGILAHVTWGFTTAATYEAVRARRVRSGYTNA